MNAAIYSEASALAARAQSNGCIGSVEDAAEWERLNPDLGSIIPDWLITLMTSVPLSGLGFGRQAFEPEPGDDGALWLWWMDTGSIRSEMLKSYPGVPLLQAAYLCVAGCFHGSGDHYFIPTDQGDDPPLYSIYHDVGDEADERLAEGRELVAPSLSAFFRAASVEAKPS